MVVGYFRAHPILVSIAALSLLMGGAALATGGQRIYPAGTGLQVFKGRVIGIPVEALYFFATVVIGQFILSWTRIGRVMVMVGSNPRAAIAAGLRTGSAVTIAYVIAGACSALAGVLLASRYSSGDMELGAGYDYSAIAAVLVGGTSIQGGAGSVVRTLVGVLVIAIIEVVLLLRGFSQQLQYLITGVIVLARHHAAHHQLRAMRARRRNCCSLQRRGLSPSWRARSWCWRSWTAAPAIS